MQDSSLVRLSQSHTFLAIGTAGAGGIVIDQLGLDPDRERLAGEMERALDVAAAVLGPDRRSGLLVTWGEEIALVSTARDRVVRARRGINLGFARELFQDVAEPAALAPRAPDEPAPRGPVRELLALCARTELPRRATLRSGDREERVVLTRMGVEASADAVAGLLDGLRAGAPLACRLEPAEDPVPADPAIGASALLALVARHGAGVEGIVREDDLWLIPADGVPREWPAAPSLARTDDALRMEAGLRAVIAALGGPADFRIDELSPAGARRLRARMDAAGTLTLRT